MGMEFPWKLYEVLASRQISETPVEHQRPVKTTTGAEGGKNQLSFVLEMGKNNSPSLTSSMNWVKHFIVI